MARSKMEKLTAERGRVCDRLQIVKRRSDKLDSQRKVLEWQAARLDEVLHREQLKLAVGDDVRCTTSRGKPAWLTRFAGKLTDVGYKWAKVDYGNRGLWRIRLADVAIA